MKKIISIAVAMVLASSAICYAKASKPNPLRAECVEQAKQEGVAKAKMAAYVKKCVKMKKADKK